MHVVPWPHVIQVCCACILYPHVGTLCLHGGKLCCACAMCLWNLTHITLHSYGFQVMCSYESPLIPFQIFTLWFPIPSWTIIFDTACKLHVTVYKESQCSTRIATWFYVDRFHRRGHIGCRKCYFVDMYNSMNIKALEWAGNFCIFPHTSVYAPPFWEAMNRENVWWGLFYELASRYGLLQRREVNLKFHRSAAYLPHWCSIYTLSESVQWSWWGLGFKLIGCRHGSLVTTAVIGYFT